VDYPEAVNLLIEYFMRYPGIGKKTAERYALHTINQFKEEDYLGFIEALHRVNVEIKPCDVCGNLTDQPQCKICLDHNRDHTKILVVEESKDVIVIEKTRTYHGLYHVLNGVISPSNGMGPDEIRIKELLSRLEDPRVEEVILATNFSDEGETTAMYLHRLLEKTDLLITRIAYGLPAGGNISYADEMTLFKALEGRKKI
jgi:recombination protein RecR